MKDLPIHYFNELGERIRQITDTGGDVIRLDIGAPDLPPPDPVVDTLIKSSLDKNKHSYSNHNGTPELRSAWQNYYKHTVGIDLDPDHEVLPLMGSKEGIFHLPLTMLDRGDIVLVPDPGYITYSRGTIISEAVPYYLPLIASNNFLPDLENIPKDILCRTKIIWLNYPNNPTSSIANKDFFKHVLDVAREFNILICYDSAYSRVTFNKYSAPSIFQIDGATDHVVEFNTLSKSHNMAGWRSGVVVGNRDAIALLYQFKTNADSGYFLPIIDASITALDTSDDWIDERNNIYRERRDIVIKYLQSMGLYTPAPDATLYVWAPIPDGSPSLNFCKNLLNESHVSVTPGIVFGESGEGFIRIALTRSLDRIEEGMMRMKNWILNGGGV